jgi:triacylglycerol lipase
MHSLFVVAALFALTATSSVALAQVPPDIAEGIRKIGPINDPPGTAKLYAPLFADHKEPYPNVTVVRDIAYGTDPLEKLDVFTAGADAGCAQASRHLHPRRRLRTRGQRPAGFTVL